MRKDDKQKSEQMKEPIDMTSDELLDYALAPELADKVKQAAKPQESTDSEQEC